MLEAHMAKQRKKMDEQDAGLLSFPEASIRRSAVEAGVDLPDDHEEKEADEAARAKEQQLAKVRLAKAALEASMKLNSTIEQRQERENLAKLAEKVVKRKCSPKEGESRGGDGSNAHNKAAIMLPDGLPVGETPSRPLQQALLRSGELSNERRGSNDSGAVVKSGPAFVAAGDRKTLPSAVTGALDLVAPWEVPAEEISDIEHKKSFRLTAAQLLEIKKGTCGEGGREEGANQGGE